MKNNFKKVLVTEQYIFYCDLDEYDENSNTIMYDSNMKLISDNYFAYIGLMEELEEIYKKKIIPKFIHSSLNDYLEEYFGE